MLTEASYMRMYSRRYLFTRGSLSSIGEQPAGDGDGDGDGESECAATRKNKVRKLEGPKARVRGYIAFLLKRPPRLTSYVHAMVRKFALENANKLKANRSLAILRCHIQKSDISY